MLMEKEKQKKRIGSQCWKRENSKNQMKKFGIPFATAGNGDDVGVGDGKGDISKLHLVNCGHGLCWRTFSFAIN